MALHMLASNWLVCGWLLSLLVGTGVVILHKTLAPEQFASGQPRVSFFQSVKWDGGWQCYAEIRGRMEDERVRIGSADLFGFAGSCRENDTSGWTYV